MSTKTVAYVIVTPVRDEETHLPRTIESVSRQTILPVEWVIINDGSSDKTGEIIDAAVAKYPWIRAVHRVNRGFRKSGGGVVEAFNDGYNTLRSRDWDFIVKLDGDLSFADNYFERCFDAFQNAPRLGITGGTIYNLINGEQVLEACPEFHVRGATKIYRRGCWNSIGGLMSAPGWDTLDEVHAQMQGWSTRTLRDLPLVHYRVTGAADGKWGGLVKNGRANYICGYHPLFMTVKCISRLIRPPYLMGSLALAYGFVSGYIKRIPQVNNMDLIRYLRNEQMGRLLGRQTIWR